MLYFYINAGVLSAALLLFYLAVKKFREPSVKILLLIPALVFGFTLYLVGYIPALIAAPKANPMSFGNVMNGIIRALTSTIQMMGGKDDYGVMANNNGYFLTYGYIVPFKAAHFLAVLVTIMAALTVFGRNLASKFRRLRNYATDTYIIYGANTKSLCLAQNIMNSHRDKSEPKRFVVIIDERADKAAHEKTSRIGAVLLGEPIFSSNKLNMNALLKAGLRNKRKRLYVFAFTESDVINYSIAQSVWDAAIENCVSQEKLKGIYVYTDTAAIVEELEAKKDKLEDKAKELLKEDRYRYNFNYFFEEDLASRVLINANPVYKRLAFDASNGLPKKERKKPIITVVILGFGATGIHILRQLLVNGQFEGCVFEAAVFDRHMDDLKGTFIKKYPALFDKTSCRDIEISFYNESVSSLAFYDTLSNLLKENGGIDYIVSCLGDDDLNFKVISDIRGYLIKKPIERDNVPVLAAHIADKKYQLFNDDEESIGKISVFGDYDELFTHKIIVNEKLDSLAKAVDSVAYGGSNWPALSLHEKNSNRAVASYIGAYLYMMGLDLASAEDEKRLQGTGIDYKALTAGEFKAILDSNRTLLENLGRSEHRRWNVFHYASGWERKPLRDVGSFADRKDPKSRLHACLVDWEDLIQVGEHITEVSRNAGIDGKSLDKIKNDTGFQALDMNNIYKIFDIIADFNSRVEDAGKLHIIRRIESENIQTRTP